MIFGITARCESAEFAEDLKYAIDSVREYHPHDKIVIVDSDSPLKDYFNDYKDYENVIIEDIANKGYETGALWYIYENYYSDCYFFMQDVMRLYRNIEEFKNDDIRVCFLFDGWEYAFEEDKEFAKAEMVKTKYRYMDSGFKMVCYNSFLVNRSVLDKFKEKNLDKIIPYNKNGSQAMERILGMAFLQEGYDLTNFDKHHLPWETVSKKWGCRQ